MNSHGWRIDLSRYAFSRAFELRYGDLNSQGQLHELAIGRMLEATRYQMLRALANTPAAHLIDNVTAQVTFERLRPAVQGREIIGAAGVLRIGQRSYVLGLSLFSDGCCQVLSDVVHVLVDADLRPRVLTECGRAALRRWQPAHLQDQD